MPEALILDRLDLRQSYILQKPPKNILSRFTVENGRMAIDGPRAQPSGSIDFSDLLTNAQIYSTFMSVAFGGGEMSSDVFGIVPETESSYTGDSLVKVPGEVDVISHGFGRPISRKLNAMLLDAQHLISEQTNVKFHTRTKARLGGFTVFNIFPADRDHTREIALEFHDLANNAPDDSRQGHRIIGRILDTFAKSDINCSAFPTFYDDKRPRAVLIIIKTDAEDEVGCIYEELVQSMGLYRDNDFLVSTLFTDSYKYYKRPTRLDWLMLKVLYDPRLRNGMTRSEAGPIVKRILAEIRPYGEGPAASS